MCGIVGLYRTAQSPGARVACVKRMLAEIRHRGPDEMGYYVNDDIALGNARLSILDLATGQQPMSDREGRHWIVFNGEIYNYRELRDELSALGRRFASSSDTEVLLQAWIEWGIAALDRLNGAFAFAILDRQDQTLVLGRDRFGKRPLYYTGDVHRGLMFASELKCFRASEGFRFEFDLEQLATVFRVWTPLEDRTIFRGVQQVPPGACLFISRNGSHLVHFAPLQLTATPTQMSEEEASDAVREALAQAVSLRLRSDVPVAAYLSGGIDSAIVATLIAEQSTGPLKTFSVSFGDKEFDESADQALMVDRLGCEHAEVRIQDRDIVEAFPQALWHAEVPVFRAAFVPMFLLSRLVHQSGIKVAMTGEGADEAFLGYDIFKETMLRSAWHTLSGAAREAHLARLYPYIPSFTQYGRAALASLFERFSADPHDWFFSHQLRFHNSQLAGRLLRPQIDGLQHVFAHVQRWHATYAPLSAVQRAQWLEYKTLLSGYLLSTQGDRMALAHAVENRCPFLDPNVVRLALQTNLRFNDGQEEKYLLKRAFGERLPERILRKPKQPYRAPDAAAFVRDPPAYLESIRSEHELSKIDGFDARFGAAFANKILAKAPEAVTQAESQAFLFLLSTRIVHEQFVAASAATSRDIDSLLVKRIDQRRAA